MNPSAARRRETEMRQAVIDEIESREIEETEKIKHVLQEDLLRWATHWTAVTGVSAGSSVAIMIGAHDLLTKSTILHSVQIVVLGLILWRIW